MEVMVPRLHPLVCCLTFVGFSTWCTLYNKYILQEVLPSSNLLLLFQGCVTIASLHAMQFLGMINCPSISLRWPRLKASSSDRADLTVGLLYALNVMFGLWSLKFLTIPIFGTLKRAAVVVVWLGEYFILNTRGAAQCLPPLLVMVAGATLAGLFDLHFVALGYFFAMLSSLAQATAFVLSKKAISQTKELPVSERIFSMLYYNSWVSVPLLAVVVFITEGWEEAFSGLRHSGSLSWAVTTVIVNGLSVMAMNYSIFLNCNVNSPLSHAICGNVKAVITTCIGIVLFQKPLNTLGALGIMLNFAGTGWYSWVKYLQNLPQPTERKPGEACEKSCCVL
eukprot:RCo008650